MSTPVIDNSSVFEEQVPVQIFETVDDGERELYYCNHADTFMTDTEDINGNTNEVEVCRRCDSYKPFGDSRWHDAPFGGKHE